MKVVNYLSKVDKDKCIGCRLCESICPTDAISMLEKKAVVDENLCRACGKCEDVCPDESVILVERSEPLMVSADVDTVDEAAIDELCAKADLFPEQMICACTMTPVKEAAAAILNGARTPEDISIMTGVRTGCGIYCMGAIQRLLNANGIELKPPANNRWYKQCLSMWDIPDDVAKNNPGYFIKEDQGIYRNKIKGGERDVE